MKGTGIKFKLRFALVFFISLIVGLFIGLPPFEPSVLGQSARKLMSAIADNPVPNTPTPIPDYKGEIIRLTNAERMKAGLGALRENDLLDKAAKDKAEDLIDRRYWAHYVLAEGENSTWKFITSTGYDYLYAGENLGRGFTDPKSLLSGWMDSNEHKKNILDGRYTEIGVHVARGAIGIGGWDELIVVQVFGTPYNQKRGTSNANAASKKTFPVDADPVIACSVSANCGGGTRLMKKSVCENSTCCRIGKSWIFYEDKNQCQIDQKEHNQIAYPPCQVYGKTFNVSPETCRYYQQQQTDLANIGKSLDTTGSSFETDQPPTNTTMQGKSNAQYRTECIGQMEANYNPLIEKYNAMGEMYKSYVGSLTQQRDSAIGSCMVEYPTYLD